MFVTLNHYMPEQKQPDIFALNKAIKDSKGLSNEFKREWAAAFAQYKKNGESPIIANGNLRDSF